MRPIAKIALGLALVGAASAWAGAPGDDPPKTPRGDAAAPSLLGRVAAWSYPGSTITGGAQMSDGGNPKAESIKCRAILTTPDPVDAVAAYYEKRLGPDPAEPRSVDSQDDSAGRPVSVRVFVAHTLDTSTTLVVSRAAGEPLTHIAWSQHARFALAP